MTSSLCSTWTLRTLVVPLLTDPGDLYSLSSAFPAALFAPCCRRLCSLFGVPRDVGDMFCVVHPADVFLSSHTLTGVQGLLLAFSRRGWPELVGQLARQCRGLGAAVCAPASSALSDALAAAASAASAPTLRALARIDGVAPGAYEAAGPRALVAACGSGGAGVAEVLALLACPPFCCAARRDFLGAALRAACTRARLRAVQALGAAPYCAGRSEASELDKRGRNALACACGSENVSVVEELVREPFGVGSNECRAWECKALAMACSSGCAEMVTRLTLPPFNMAHDEACTCSAALNGSCSAAVLDVLASEPFSLCFNDVHSQANSMLRKACETLMSSSLCSAWTLRTLVVPLMTDQGDLCSLCSAFPAALFAPCCRRLRRIFRDSVADADAETPMHTGVAGLLVAFSERGWPELVGQLARQCRGLGAAVCAPASSALSDALAAAASAASTPTLHALARIDGVAPGAYEADGPEALVAACSGGGAGVEEVLALLACPPFCCAARRDFLGAALCTACAHGCLEAVQVLGAAPYCAGRSAAAVLDNGGRNALACACGSGNVSVVDALVREPFRVGRRECRAWECEALAMACSSGSAEMVTRLTLPPFSMGQAEARMCRALRAGCGSAAVLDVLASEPFSLGFTDVLSTESLVAFACKKLVPVILDAGAVERVADLTETFYWDERLHKRACRLFGQLLLHNVPAERVAAAGVVQVAMRCVEMSRRESTQMEGFRVLYNATARHRGDSPSGARGELWATLYRTVRRWGFVEKISLVPLEPGDLQAEVGALVRGFRRTEHPRVAETMRRRVCTAVPWFCAGDCVRQEQGPCSVCWCQQWCVRCRTCFGSDVQRAVCAVCAAACHQGHELSDWRFAPCRCGCCCAKTA
eukprot:m51a1_g8650 hypothetical protein (882) ;mRNA; f:30223-37763